MPAICLFGFGPACCALGGHIWWVDAAVEEFALRVICLNAAICLRPMGRRDEPQ